MITKDQVEQAQTNWGNGVVKVGSLKNDFDFEYQEVKPDIMIDLTGSLKLTSKLVLKSFLSSVKERLIILRIMGLAIFTAR